MLLSALLPFFLDEAGTKLTQIGIWSTSAGADDTLTKTIRIAESTIRRAYNPAYWSFRQHSSSASLGVGGADRDFPGGNKLNWISTPEGVSTMSIAYLVDDSSLITANLTGATDEDTYLRLNGFFNRSLFLSGRSTGDANKGNTLTVIRYPYINYPFLLAGTISLNNDKSGNKPTIKTNTEYIVYTASSITPSTTIEETDGMRIKVTNVVDDPTFGDRRVTFTRVSGATYTNQIHLNSEVAIYEIS